MEGQRVAWIAPEYKNTRPLWRTVRTATGMAVKYGLARVSESERVIEFPRTGGSLGLYSGDNPDAMRGEAFHLVVCDEAARLKPDVWQDVLQPTLADYGGYAVLISTPKGRNWFWQEWVRGQAQGDDIAAWQAPSSDNPNPNIQHAALLARDRVPERTYRQEWLAEFVDDGGGVFRRVTEAATAEAQDTALDGHEYVFGVDWGKSNDWTVVAVVDTTTQALVALDRFNQIDYTVQVGRLQALAERFHPVVIVAERNSMGEPLVEQLQRLDLPVQPFLTTNATKTAAIDALALAFERGSVHILPDPVLVAELQAYDSERLPSGLMRYGAPEGMHDDTVMALAMAWQACSGPSPSNMIAFV